METLALENKGVREQALERQAEAQRSMNALWMENRGMVLQRVDMLERECWQWLRAPQSRGAGVVARDMAHKLAGVLGTFGMKRGSMIAARIEMLAGMPGQGRAVNSTMIYALLHELRDVVRAKH